MIIIGPKTRNVTTKSTPIRDEYDTVEFMTMKTTDQSEGITMYPDLRSKTKNAPLYIEPDGSNRNDSFANEIQNEQRFQESRLVQAFHQLSFHNALLILFLSIIFLLVIVLMIIGSLVLKNLKKKNIERTWPKHLTPNEISNPYSVSLQYDHFHRFSRSSSSSPSTMETTSTMDDLPPRILRFCEHDTEYVEIE